MRRLFITSGLSDEVSPWRGHATLGSDLRPCRSTGPRGPTLVGACGVAGRSAPGRSAPTRIGARGVRLPSALLPLLQYPLSLSVGDVIRQRGAVVGEPVLMRDLRPVVPLEPLDGSKENPMHPVGGKPSLVLN